MPHHVLRAFLRLVLLALLLGHLPPASLPTVQAAPQAAAQRPSALSPASVSAVVAPIASVPAPLASDSGAKPAHGASASLFVSPVTQAHALPSFLADLQQTTGPQRPSLIYRNDFEQSIGSAWSSSASLQRLLTPRGNRRFLGTGSSGFGNNAVTLTLNNVPADRITLAFDLYILYTWDGNGNPVTCPGPDRWEVGVVGASTPLLSTTFANNPPATGSSPGCSPGVTQAFPLSNGSFPPKTGAVERNTLGYAVNGNPADAVYHLSFSFLHTGGPLNVAFRAYGLQTDQLPGDETWGLDNVQVRVGALPLDQQRNAVCPSCQYHWPYPVNTRTGNYWTKVTDLQVESPGVPIAWTRTYNSQGVDETTVLGAGWQHPYNARLITPSMSGGETDRISIMSPTGNRLRFDDPGTGAYDPWPGVNSTLTKNGATYIQTLRDQSQYHFRDSDGMLTAMRDPQGRQLTIQYKTSPSNEIDRIVDASNTGRYLQPIYSGGRITSLVDSAGRSVSYSYDGSGNLTATTDVRQQQTTYSYANPTNHLLTRIRNPLQQDVERIGYKTSVAPTQVLTQTLHDGRNIAFSFPDPTGLGGTTIITSTGIDGRTDVVELDYAGDNTLVAMRNTSNSANVWQMLSSAFDDSFSPGLIRDGNGNPATLFNTTQGLPITTTDALGQLTLNEYDSNNNLLRTVDPLGITMRYRYDSLNNVISQTLGLASTNQATATTLFTYRYKVGTTWGSSVTGATDSRLFEETGPDGVVTRYLYDDANGQPHRVVTVILGPSTAAEQHTTYTYDALGRIETVTVAANVSAVARTDKMVYNPDNTVKQKILNFKDSNYLPSRPDEDVITSYGYDRLGRTIVITDTLGRVDLTRYNDRGQVEANARNVSLPWATDAQGQPIIPAFSVTAPDRNLATLYTYDGLGRMVLLTETGILTGSFNLATLRFSAADERVTRSEYDELGRLIALTRNYRANDPRQTPDLNVRETTEYDAAGNLIKQTDAYGRETRTVYDVLNRTIQTIQNYHNGQVDSGEPADRDLTTLTEYDAGGRVTRTIENAINGVVDSTDTITDRVTLYAYDSLYRVTSTTLNHAQGRSGQEYNRESLTQYDPVTTRQRSQRTPLFQNGLTTDERWSWIQQYDPVGRVQISVENCRTSAGAPVAQNCAAYNPTYRDRNIATRNEYDVLGRVVATTQNYVNGSFSTGALDEDIQTRTSYDRLGRVVATTRNYVNGSYVDGAPAEDVTTRYGYDGLGRTIAMTETVTASQSAITRTSYDGLGRPITTTDPANRVTQFGYDGSGIQRWQKLPDGRVTVMQVDGLGRVVTTIENYHNGSLDGDPADRDLIARVVYDAAGRQVQTIDPAGRVTQFAYDNADRLIGVTENLIAGGCASLPADRQPCNVVTQYRYDRAGNRVAIVDARNYTRTFTYNAASEQTHAIDALGRTTQWQYDALGRVMQQLDPRQTTASPSNTYNLTYSYDGLDRLTQTAPGHSNSMLGLITTLYDALGRRRSLTDQSGVSNFTYDALGHITQVQTTPVVQPAQTTGYAYNGRGDRVKLVYPDATQLNYNYLVDGRLSQVTQGVSSPATLATYNYDSMGRLVQMAPANASVTNYRYDGADRLLRMTTAISGTTVAGFQYQNDRLGQRTVVTETLPLSPLLSPTRIKTITFEGAALLDPVTGADSIHQTPTSVALESATPINGAYSARAATDSGYLRKELTTPLDELFVSFYLRVDSIPAGASNLRILQISNGGTTVGTIQLLTNGKLRMRNGSTTIGLDSATLQFGQVYRVGLRQKKGSGANGVMEAFLADASSQYQFTSAFAASSTETFTSQATRVNIGGTVSGPLNIVLDDITLDSGAWPPPAMPMSAMEAGGSASTALSGASFTPAATDPPAATAGAAFGRLPVAFTPNAGQTDSSVRFQARGLGGNLFFRSGELVLALRPPAHATTSPPGQREWRPSERRVPSAIVRQHFIGASPTATMTGTLGLPGRANFLLGNDPSRWRTNLRTYAGVVEQQLYPGIDLHTTGIGGQIKRTFTLAPGADPARIRWRYDGATDVRLDGEGRLVVTLPTPATTLTDTVALPSSLTEEAPVAWQTVNEREVAVPIRFVVGPNRQVSFALGAYDTTLPLTIDPTLIYSHSLNNSTAASVAVDSAGNAYVTGDADVSFPTTPGAVDPTHNGSSDVFVAKLDPSGTGLIYSTYLGGNGSDSGKAITVDSSGQATVTGYTLATQSTTVPFPTTISAYDTTHNGLRDVFVTRLNVDGSGLIYSTYLGSAGHDFAYNIALDAAGNAYITGETDSTGFPLVNAYQTTYRGNRDVVVAKLSANGSQLLYSTYLGGSSTDQSYGLVLHTGPSNAIYASITGQTASGTGSTFLFPTTAFVYDSSHNGLNDAFVATLNPALSGTASLVASTFLGGTGSEIAYGIAADPAGNLAITGWSDSTNLPTSTNAWQSLKSSQADAFVLQLNPSLSQLRYGTYLGGTGYESGNAIAAMDSGNLAITGWTDSQGSFPLQNSWYGFAGGICNYPTFHVCTDAFVSILNPTGMMGSLVFSTYLGGNGDDYGYGIASGATGTMYVVGRTESTNFPRTGNVSNFDGNDIFVLQLRDPAAPPDTRAIHYSYDGLLRLREALENPGHSYRYAYDLAGNRTDVWIDNIPSEPHRTYDGANQVVGWQYDQAGNLTGDGANTYVYDALNRVQQIWGKDLTTFEYDGDGNLVERTVSSTSGPGGTTRYVQDLAAPLSQVLQITPPLGSVVNYLYGLERLAAQSGTTKTWYAGDALGSVRRTINQYGVPGATISYDPWGQPQFGVTPPTFGFTGELHDATVGLVNLRSRWYSTNHGTFTSRDPFAGTPELPYSLHPYQYAYSDPVLLTDPTGEYPGGPSGPEGIRIHQMIQRNFVAWSLTWSGYQVGDVISEYPVPKGSKFQPNKQGKVPFERYEYMDDLTLLVPLKPSTKEEGNVDLADLRANEIYEIKPKRAAREGRDHLFWYLAHMPGFRAGSRFYPEPGGVRVIGDWPTVPYNKDWEVIARIHQGVIVYEGRPKNHRLKNIVAAVCTLTVAAIAGKKIADEIRGRPKPGPGPLPEPRPAFEGLPDGEIIVPLPLGPSVDPFSP